MTSGPKNWVRPGDAEYDELREVYNAAHQACPSLIVRVGSVDDVRAALSHAQSEGLSVAVRGGGHSIAGFSTVEGGLVIDLRDLNTITLDAADCYWVGGGALAGDVAGALAPHGLVVPLGDSADVGIAGLTLGGGIGWLARRFGLTLDSLVAAEIVTADGTVSIVDAWHQPELFWALRGGGGAFGVATRLRFQPHRLGPVLGGTMLLPLSMASLADVLAIAAAAPDDLGMIVLATRPPDDPHAVPVLAMTLVWSGEISEGQAVLAQLRAVAVPIKEDIRERPYADMFQINANGPRSITNATESMFVDALDADAIERIVAAASTPPRTASSPPSNSGYWVAQWREYAPLRRPSRTVTESS